MSGSVVALEKLEVNDIPKKYVKGDLEKFFQVDITNTL